MQTAECIMIYDRAFVRRCPYELVAVASPYSYGRAVPQNVQVTRRN